MNKALKIINNKYLIRFSSTIGFMTLICCVFLWNQMDALKNVYERVGRVAIEHLNTDHILNLIKTSFERDELNIVKDGINIFANGNNSEVFKIGLILVIIFSLSLSSLEKTSKFNGFMLTIPVNKKIIYLSKLLYGYLSVIAYVVINFLISCILIYNSSFVIETGIKCNFGYIVYYFVSVLIQLLIIFTIIMAIGTFTGNFIGQLATCIPIFGNFLFLMCSLSIVIISVIGVNTVFVNKVAHMFEIFDIDMIVYLCGITWTILRLKMLIVWAVIALIFFAFSLLLVDNENIKLRRTVYTFSLPRKVFLGLLILDVSALITIFTTSIFFIEFRGSFNILSTLMFVIICICMYFPFRKLFDIKIGN